ncbi:MAG TPA: glycosyltransferase family 4 protein [Geminicoccus sp.]|uniref:glycosyltransferase family 4 protein n=1 Tax=Geminicoccus sp. TaxID=2024832 RepID=UPI002E31A1B7|nr:glycosyltransferase family 4 protein [Geminicoccus sp.]HEX2529741.1 glycosyltransferase family 4 protein [Geminicoccus sp.]
MQIVADGRPGGGTSVVLDLCRGLRARHGHDVVLASAPSSYVLEAASQDGIEVHHLDLWRGRLDRRAPAALKALLDRVRPDLLHAHGSRAGLAVARSLDRPNGPPFAYTVHGYHFATKAWPHKLAAAMAEWRIGRRASAVTWVCAADRALAAAWRLDPGRAVDQVVYNGLDIASLPAVAAADPGLVAFLGRLVPQKNPELAVDLLTRPELGDARLVMIGGGPLEGALWARARAAGVDGRLRITGPLERGQALAELARAAVLVLPSLWEGIPVALAEAMGIGVPVVAASVRGVPELVEHGVSGLLRSDPHDLEGFAHDVGRILRDPILAGTMVRHARAAVAERCRLEGMVDAYHELYLRICNHVTGARL